MLFASITVASYALQQGVSFLPGLPGTRQALFALAMSQMSLCVTPVP